MMMMIVSSLAVGLGVMAAVFGSVAAVCATFLHFMAQ
jgi:hypothetical protein